MTEQYNASHPEGWSVADLHIHTNLSDGVAHPGSILKTAIERGLRVIAVTDHDSLEGAKKTQDLIERYNLPIEVIMGTEVTTRQGHFLGLFLQKRIKMYRSVEYTIDAIKEQGGICIVPHPLGKLVPSLSQRKIDELIERGFVLDGIELYNPSPANAAMRSTVRTLNLQWGFAGVGGSDAHFRQHVGGAYTLFEGSTAADLKNAIINRTTKSGGEELSHAHLPIPAYVAQCAWSWFVDPPRRMLRAWRDPV